VKPLTIRNSADRPEILLYGTIGDDWSDDFVTAKMFADALAALPPGPEVGVRINSFGGSVADGFAMYNALKTCGRKVVVDVDGFAVSAASTVMMGGDERRMHENSVVMIHRPQSFNYGYAADFRKEADVLDLLQNQIAGVYAARSGKTADEFNKLMDAETWFSAEQAKEAGLATEVVANAGADEDDPETADPEPEPAMNRMLAIYRNVPAAVRERLNVKQLKAWRNNIRRRRLELLEKSGD
jgi:ATP-dependent Clp endopeptidase proteolytic subunit ClpP